MKLGRLEIRLLPSRARGYEIFDTGKDLSQALTVPETDNFWRAVHQCINEVESETTEAARRYTANAHQCIAAVGAGEGAALVRMRLIEKREAAIAESKKLAQQRAG